MSDLFQQQWLRMTPGARLHRIVTYLSRKGDITIPVSELESIPDGEGTSQSFILDNLVIHHAPVGTQLFVSQERQNYAERQPQPWTATESEIPGRLSQVLRDPPPNPNPTTTNDSFLADLEARFVRAEELKRRAAEVRGRPLTVPQPPMAPEQ
jgi:hypothetical protein